jgi:hypothetical protein
MLTPAPEERCARPLLDLGRSATEFPPSPRTLLVLPGIRLSVPPVALERTSTLPTCREERSISDLHVA